MINSFDFEEEERRMKLEALSSIRTYKKSIHPDFDWWKERERVESKKHNRYGTLRPQIEGEPTAPPEEVLRTLDKFESLLAWLENKPIGQEMTAYEKAQVVCRLLDVTGSRDLSVSLKSNSLDVNLKGDSDYPVSMQVEGGFSPLKIEKE